MTEIHPGGLFEAEIEGAELPLKYKLKVDYGSGRQVHHRGPVRLPPTIGELDLHLMGEGRHEELYERLGAHVIEMGDPPTQGTAFAVWAPAARAVSVVGDFNSWDGRLHAMRSMGSSGIWELFLPEVGAGQRYKYEILTQDGEILLKADPYAQETEVPPKTASVVHVPGHAWCKEGRQVPLRPRQGPAAGRARVDLRGPPGLVAAELAGGQPPAHLCRARRRALGLLRGHGLHPRRAAPGDGPPVHRLVGLPGHRLLRPHAALRLARRPARVHRQDALQGDRRPVGLGAGALPAR